MLSKIAATTLAASAVQGRSLQSKVRNNSQKIATDQLSGHPTVQAQTCSTAVGRLKEGPVDIEEIIAQSEYEASQGNILKYFDKSFYGTEAVYNT